MSSDSIIPDELTPHPKNAEVYGDPGLADGFIEDIRERGITDPIVVTDESHFAEGTVIISGHRRTEAAKETDQSVPVREYVAYDSPAEELAALLRFNDYRDKTFSQRMGEADAIEEIERSAADDRMKNPMQTLAEGESGLSRDKIAERIGIGSGETYRKAKKIWDAAQNGDGDAKKAVKKLDSGDESIHGAYLDLQQREHGTADAATGDALQNLADGGSDKTSHDGVCPHCGEKLSREDIEGVR